MKEKLIINLTVCTPEALGGIRCSYKHHPENDGMQILFEKICFALICRKCSAAPCVSACPNNALEKVPAGDGNESVLKRATMLCTGCGTCAIACPFGTIYTDLIPYPSNICDLCRGRLHDGEKPLCVRTSPKGVMDYCQVDVGGDLVEVFEDIVVNVPAGARWEPFLRNSGNK